MLVDKGALQQSTYVFSVRDGERDWSEGVPAEDARRLGCFYILACKDVSEVKDWAARRFRSSGLVTSTRSRSGRSWTTVDAGLPLRAGDGR